ncbi:MAG TPA: lipid-A-disaccharide synthase, partial [Vulgatibacter sp.]
MGPTFLIVAAEASGDLHGARLIRAIRALRPDATFVGMGGPAMCAEGLRALHRAEELSVMGFAEVVPKLAGIVRILANLARWAREHRPDAAILIDSADFNLRLARELRPFGIPTVAYIAPMAWAWRESRTRQLRDLARVLCIYPFEEPWFRERGVDAVFVG